MIDFFSGIMGLLRNLWLKTVLFIRTSFQDMIIPNEISLNERFRK
jgi:hypothetical protein